jgi:steroid delta-isomerase-like uncharacterized protein
MSVKENKALVRHVVELWNRKDMDTFFKLLAPEYIEHDNDRDMSLEQVKEYNTMFSTAFPDATSTIEDMVAEGDRVAYRVTWRGTQKGDFMGIPATGKKLEITNTTIVKLAGGKWSECWATVDDLRFLQQMGVIPKQ